MERVSLPPLAKEPTLTRKSVSSLEIVKEPWNVLTATTRVAATKVESNGTLLLVSFTTFWFMDGSKPKETSVLTHTTTAMSHCNGMTMTPVIGTITSVAGTMDGDAGH
jgi:hypothetical protein